MDNLYYNANAINSYSSQHSLYHHGVRGQRWGYRRWQNEDGTLTTAGKEHYRKGLPKVAKNLRENSVKKAYSKASSAIGSLRNAEKETMRLNKKMGDISPKLDAATRDMQLKSHNLSTEMAKGERSLFGNKSAIRRAERELAKSKKKEEAVSDEFLAINNDILASKVNEDNLKASMQTAREKANKKALNYIKRYGSVEMKNLMDNDSEFKRNVTNIESEQKYKYYFE